MHDDTTLVDVAMIRDVLTVGPAHTLRQVASAMAARNVGAAVVSDSDGAGIGIITERDILVSVGKGEDPDAELTADHRTTSVVFATPQWTIEQAAQAMLRGGFRHLIVVSDNDVAGMLSVRDVVRVWAHTD